MSLRSLLARILALLVPLALSSAIYLYLYPVVNGCAFPLPRSPSPASTSNSTLPGLDRNAVVNTFLQHVRSSPAADTEPAIFRLLVLADPQLEGDTSLPLPEWELVPRMRSHWRAVQDALDNASTTTPAPLSLLDQDVLSNITTGLWKLASDDIPRSLRAVQKQVDLFGNDYYLAHIYRTLFWWTRPTHTTVLGDLLGSQWIPDEEFSWRAQRFWGRVFRGGERVDDSLTQTGAAGTKGETAETKQQLEPLGPDSDPAWPRRVINIAGNHDIGYAGDVSEARMERFEREFGRANWDIRFQHPPVSRVDKVASDDGLSGSTTAEEPAVITPTLHLINLNTLIMDTPALSPALQDHTYNYLNDLISHRVYPVEDDTTFTLLLTHLPLHKEDGVCTDGPYFSFHGEDDEDQPDGMLRWQAGGLKEQNHLSEHVSAVAVLQGIFGMSGDKNAVGGGIGRKGLILTGHDHTGCDAVHYTENISSGSQDEASEGQEPPQSWKWSARRYNEPSETKSSGPSMREVTLRSMMGEFGGNAGLLSVWFDVERGEWDYDITMCPAGVQHIWWAVHVLALVTVIVGLVWAVLGVTTSAKTSVDRGQVDLKRSKENGPLEKSSQGLSSKTVRRAAGTRK
ncbi:hypothetical protein N7492_008973 [Penicillium capsulatum]|uniref:Calcineurin-like phosphoesterase domain-containing protein n=1 Tax=Penicillium capsulatum TaxID=69766 RepID=A0A9W9HTS2_9EURO|nr:hypothetical protein N7492_008973 [Penicillium capsulatum]KAJ6106374.1 hypothetical protein N7512_009891 [Penicillium capsulatum]